jgi:predicted Zn-dependent protease
MAVKPEVAMQELHRELTTSRDSGAANTMIAMMTLQQDDVPAALSYAEAAVKGSPDSVMARYVLGRCLIEENRISEALEQLKVAEQHDPGNLDVHISLATAYSRAGQPKEAREERLRSLELWKEKDALGNP